MVAEIMFDDISVAFVNKIGLIFITVSRYDEDEKKSSNFRFWLVGSMYNHRTVGFEWEILRLFWVSA